MIFYYYRNWKKLLNVLFLCLFAFTSLDVFGQCLADKNAGGNAANIAALDAQYNNPSPHTFRHMMGVNDAGQFQGIEDDEVNPISYLTPNMRAFHAMDYDFNDNPSNIPYYLLDKPKDFNGNPPYIDNATFSYTNFTGIQGMANISAATEIIYKQFREQGGDPNELTWKEKIWDESDWYNLTPGMSISDGIRLSYQNYTSAFINEFAPNNGTQLVGSYEVGNELWDYPFEEDYHAMLEGAYNAFVNAYGVNTNNWRMRLLPGSFNAASIVNTCNTANQDFSNCGSSPGSQAYYQMGDYLNVNNCNILESFHAINTHAYPFGEGTQNFVHPEQENNEFLTFKAAVAFRDANPVFAGKGVWLTETGYDSYNVAGSCDGNSPTGVGELSHAAMLLRIFMITSRYHLERVNFYMGFDQSRTSNNWHGCTYNSSGFWKLGTHPNNYPSARPAHGATPKPAFFAFNNFLDIFNDKVFTESLVENDELYAYILDDANGNDPYLVFWSPTATVDATALSEININQFVNLPAGYRVASTNATPFSTTGNSTVAPFAHALATPFAAVNGTNAGSTTITKVKRMPSYIRLIATCPVAGTPCNDGNPNTVNDVEDGNCNCAGIIENCNGTPDVTETGCGVTVGTDGQNINFVSATAGGLLIIKVYKVGPGGSWTEGRTLCNEHNEACSSSSVPADSEGTYAIQVGPDCSFEIIVDSSIGGGGSSSTDNDGDGICSEDDCNDNDANIGEMQIPGTACSDGDPNTNNDQIQPDGCTCGGVDNSCETYSFCSSLATIEVCGSTVTATNIDTDVNSIKIQNPNTYEIVEVLCVSWTSPDYQSCTGSPSVTVPNGIYNIKVERKNGQPECLIENVEIPTSFNRLDNSLTYDYKIVPNPAAKKATLEIDESWPKGAIEIRITNLSGQIINQEKMVYEHSRQKELNLSGLNPGSYLVNVISLVNKQKKVGLLIVKR